MTLPAQNPLPIPPRQKIGNYLIRQFGGSNANVPRSNCWAEEIVKNNSDMLFHPEAMIRIL